MWCEKMVHPDGIVTIVCHGGARPQPRRCVVCHRQEGQQLSGGARLELKLCDAPMGRRKQKTCDTAVCAVHAAHVEPDFDLCPTHAREAGQRNAP